jgi:hypothetical protein
MFNMMYLNGCHNTPSKKRTPAGLAGILKRVPVDNDVSKSNLKLLYSYKYRFSLTAPTSIVQVFFDRAWYVPHR